MNGKNSKKLEKYLRRKYKKQIKKIREEYPENRTLIIDTRNIDYRILNRLQQNPEKTLNTINKTLYKITHKKINTRITNMQVSTNSIADENINHLIQLNGTVTTTEDILTDVQNIQIKIKTENNQEKQIKCKIDDELKGTVRLNRQVKIIGILKQEYIRKTGKQTKYLQVNNILENRKIQQKTTKPEEKYSQWLQSIFNKDRKTKKQ